MARGVLQDFAPDFPSFTAMVEHGASAFAGYAHWVRLQLASGATDFSLHFLPTRPIYNQSVPEGSVIQLGREQPWILVHGWDEPAYWAGVCWVASKCDPPWNITFVRFDAGPTFSPVPDVPQATAELLSAFEDAEAACARNDIAYADSFAELQRALVEGGIDLPEVVTRAVPENAMSPAALRLLACLDQIPPFSSMGGLADFYCPKDPSYNPTLLRLGNSICRAYEACAQESFADPR